MAVNKRRKFPINKNRFPFRGKISIKKLHELMPILVNLGDKPSLRWGNLDGYAMTRPFFGRAVKDFLATGPKIITTGFDALEALADAYPALEPNGFIFHTTHCGSTLVHNVMAGRDKNLAISEPNTLDTLLCSDESDVPLETRLRWFRALVRVFGQQQAGEVDTLLFKWNSWFLRYADFFHRAYPQTPWVCVYRDPVETIVGQLKRKYLNWYFLEDKPCSKLSRKDRASISLIEAMARTFGDYYDRLLALAGDPKVLLVNYSQLSEETYSKIIQHFGLNVSEDEREQMLAKSKIYSKDPKLQKKFTGDTEDKRKEATPHILEMAEKWAMASYKRLEVARKVGAGELSQNHEALKVGVG